MWAQMLSLQDAGSTITPSTIAICMGAARQGEIKKYVKECLDCCQSTAEFWEQYAGEVSKLYRCRCIVKSASEVLEQAKAGKLMEAFESSANLIGYRHFPNGKLHSWAERETKPMNWSWKNWIGNGFSSLLVAEKGEGKTWMALRLCKTLTTGCPWPDGSAFEGEPGCVIWCEAENFHDENQRRAIAMGIPLDRMVTSIGLDSQFNMENSEHVQSLFYAIGKPEVKGLILDSYSGSQTLMDENSAKAKRVSEIMAALARTSGNFTMATHHLNKLTDNMRKQQGHGYTTKERIRGSSAITAQQRFCMAISRPELDSEMRVLHMVATNFEAPEMLPFHNSGIGPIFGGNVGDGHIKTVLELALEALYPALQRGAREASGLKAELELMGVRWDNVLTCQAKSHGMIRITKSPVDGTTHWSLKTNVSDEL
jgi:hypothetical protein